MIFDLLVLPPDRAVVLKLLLFKTLQVEVSHYFKTYILSVVVYRYISKKFEYCEKGQYFLSLISESETHVLYRFISHRVKYFKPLFLEF